MQGPGASVCRATTLSTELRDSESGTAHWGPEWSLRPIWVHWDRNEEDPLRMGNKADGQNKSERGLTQHHRTYLFRELHAAGYRGRGSPRESAPVRKHRPTGSGFQPRPHPTCRRSSHQSPARSLLTRCFSVRPLVPQSRGRDWLEIATSPQARRVAWTGFPPSSGCSACGDVEPELFALGRVGAAR